MKKINTTPTRPLSEEQKKAAEERRRAALLGKKTSEAANLDQLREVTKELLDILKGRGQ